MIELNRNLKRIKTLITVASYEILFVDHQNIALANKQGTYISKREKVRNHKQLP
jgi:hypothetical protein